MDSLNGFYQKFAKMEIIHFEQITAKNKNKI
jgi:hypothetical protein